MRDRKINPVEEALPWRDLGEAKLDPEWLFPEPNESKCSINRHYNRHSTDAAAEYVNWIQERIPNIDRKDARVCCPYCDMKNHPRWTCHHIDKHRDQSASHSCTLCIGDHPAFLYPIAKCNNGVATPNWAQREKKQAKDDNRKPDCI